MFLQEIRLRNFRCFDDLTISFVQDDGGIRKWTILLGENGSGKSNLLKGIALITAGSDALPELLGAPDEWIQYRKQFCELEAVMVTKGEKERQIKLRINRGDGPSDVILRNQESLRQLDATIEHSQRNYFVVGYGATRHLSPERNLRGEGKRSATARARNVVTLFDPDALLAPLESWAMDLDYRKNRAGVDTVRKVLTSFLREVSFSRIDKQKKQLLFKTRYGIVPMHMLSDGYQNMASWVGDLLYRVSETFDDYKTPLKARGLLLIDEIDLHLHLKWQRELLRFVNQRLPNLQLIVTTHSPITAQQAGKGELHHLERVGKKIRLEVFDGVPKSLLLHQLVMSDLFGLESDESVETETKKKAFRRLRDKGKLSPAEEKKLQSLTDELDGLPSIQRSHSVLDDEQTELLRRIERELKE